MNGHAQETTGKVPRALGIYKPVASTQISLPHRHHSSTSVLHEPLSVPQHAGLRSRRGQRTVASQMRSGLRKRPPARTLAIAFLLLGVRFVLPTDCHAASLIATQQLFYEGKYHECAEVARHEVERGVWNERWPELLMECYLETGQYRAARDVFEQELTRFSRRIPFRMLGVDVYHYNGQPAKAYEQMETIYRLVDQSPWAYGSTRDQVTLGRYFALRGEDSRQILELIYDAVRRRNPNNEDVYVATAELAIEKHDFGLASEQLDRASKLAPANPQIPYLQAVAFRESDGARATEALQRALELNPNHVPSLLLRVDQLIDAERYDAAEALLTRVLEINLQHPMAWAYYAVLAHLEGNYDAELKLRECALWSYKSNPNVDYTIGKKLSQKYRFREGVSYQRLALAADPKFVPAQFQLANDLLRLGDDREGWQLASSVHEKDNYHVEAYNLVQLRQRLDQFTTLESEHFVVRMQRQEAAVYGASVVRLLEEAYSALVPKYDAALDRVTHVEIFERQEDFAIRTFGLPGGEGFLGVCFGPLITANSPASQGTSPTNWESVLWHEFCHVVTLQKTNNRMPRWLSEGISVYEERQRDPAWGQTMTPQFKRMIQQGELTPVSQLSGAFLRPPSAAHLQFAYYESSLVVEYLIEEHGLDVLRLILSDLAIGMPINEALQRYVGSMTGFDKQFEAYAKLKAEQLAPELDWNTDLIVPDMDLTQLLAALERAPNNYWLLLETADQQLRRGDFASARVPLERIRQAFPNDANGALPRLARIYRELSETQNELQAYRDWAAHDADAITAFQALITDAADREDWDTMADYATRLVRVNPMRVTSQRAAARAARQSGELGMLIEANTALLEMEPADPAKVHFQIASARAQRNDATQNDPALAKRHVLKSLEVAPRYRDAQRLLLQLVSTSNKADHEPAESDEDSREITNPTQPDEASSSADRENLRGQFGRGRGERRSPSVDRDSDESERTPPSPSENNSDSSATDGDANDEQE